MLAWARTLLKNNRRSTRLSVAGICLVAIVTPLPWRIGIVTGSSMWPTLASGSPFLYDRSYYRTHSPRSGEIVVFGMNGTIWVKRIYATEGTCFWSLRESMDGHVRLDPIRASQKGDFMKIAADYRADGVDVQVIETRVPPGQVFVVGDGAYTMDSRDLGPVEIARLLGRAIEMPGQRFGRKSVELSFPARTGRPLQLVGPATASP